MTPARKKLLVTIVLPIQLLLAVLSWRDISRRTDAQVRGRKTMWRVAVLLNPGNSLAYWVFGRC